MTVLVEQARDKFVKKADQLKQNLVPAGDAVAAGIFDEIVTSTLDLAGDENLKKCSKMLQAIRKDYLQRCSEEDAGFVESMTHGEVAAIVRTEDCQKSKAGNTGAGILHQEILFHGTILE